jgi:hypothetical protein
LENEETTMKRSYVWHNQSSHPDESYCSREKIWKPKSEFNYQNKELGILQDVCRECMQELVHNRYANNKEVAKAINRVSALNAREVAREYVYQYLLEHSCMDCGETDPLVLTFDHVSGNKKLGISDMVGRGWSIETIKSEIRKCDVVCFNCHMRREYERRR